MAAKTRAYLAEHKLLSLSSRAVLEVVHGYRRVGREDKLHNFEHALTSCEVLAFDDAAGRLAGKIYADLEARGRPICLPDVMIAAIALTNDVALATANVAHFEFISAMGHDGWHRDACSREQKSEGGRPVRGKLPLD